MQFEKHAHNYDKNCQWQKKIAQNLKKNIFSQDIVDDFDEIVDLGCGTGYLTEMLIEKYNSSKVLLDYSSKMLQQAESKLGKRHSYIQGNIQNEKKYLKRDKKQLIVSNLAFQWLENKQILTLKRLYNKMNKSSKIFITTLIHGSYKNYYKLLDDYGFEYKKIDFVSKKYLLNFDFIKRFSFSTQELAYDNIVSFLKTLHFSGAIRKTDINNIKKLRSLITNYGTGAYKENIKVAYLMISK